MHLDSTMGFEESAVRAIRRGADDRRASERAPLAAPVLLDNLKTWHSVRCRDVSATGMAVRSSEPLSDMQVGETVEVYFELPSGVAVETQARVVRHDGAQLALEFLGLDPDARLALKAHCRVRTVTEAMSVTL